MLEFILLCSCIFPIVGLISYIICVGMIVSEMAKSSENILEIEKIIKDKIKYIKIE